MCHQNSATNNSKLSLDQLDSILQVGIPPAVGHFVAWNDSSERDHLFQSTGRPVNVKHDARCVIGKVGGRQKTQRGGFFIYFYNSCVTIKCSKTHIQPFVLKAYS